MPPVRTGDELGGQQPHARRRVGAPKRLLGDCDLTLCTGPAGTGKTYLAVAAAVCMLKHGQARKLAGRALIRIGGEI